MIGAEFAATLARAQGGDEEAAARLFRDLQPLLLRYLRVTVAPGAAEDVAGNTWLDVVAGLDRFSGGEMQFRAWLFTIARHRAIDAARARERRPRTVPLAGGGAEERLTPRTPPMPRRSAPPRGLPSRWSRPCPRTRRRSSCCG